MAAKPYYDDEKEVLGCECEYQFDMCQPIGSPSFGVKMGDIVLASKRGMYLKIDKRGTYALHPVAVRKTSNMWKFSSPNWERITDGDATPAAARALPKMAPAAVVAIGFAMIAVVLRKL